MPIDLEREKPVTFAQLAESLPRHRRNRPVHTSTIHRWRRPGLRGVRLEAIRVGGAWHTTREAFAKFCKALTSLEDSDIDTVTAPEESRQQQQNSAVLDEDGW